MTISEETRKYMDKVLLVVHDTGLSIGVNQLLLREFDRSSWKRADALTVLVRGTAIT